MAASEPDVLGGAFRIACEEYPDLDVHTCRRQLDGLVRRARERVTRRGRDAVEQLNGFFFGHLGFRGNREDYYDPRNSYLNDVLERRTGIPISLSVVYCEIGRRLGLATCGIGFPGHFLARVSTPDEDLIVDCFNARILSREECGELVAARVQGAPGPSGAAFEPASPSDILVRMLHNLRQIYAARKEFNRVARWIGLELEFRPDATVTYRDRGMAWIQAEEFGKAVVDLERYADLAPGAADLPQVREQIQLIRKLLCRLN